MFAGHNALQDICAGNVKMMAVDQGEKVRGGWMKEATGGGGAMCGRGGGWICLLYYLIQAASHTNTICHHSH